MKKCQNLTFFYVFLKPCWGSRGMMDCVPMRPSLWKQPVCQMCNSLMGWSVPFLDGVPLSHVRKADNFKQIFWFLPHSSGLTSMQLLKLKIALYFYGHVLLYLIIFPTLSLQLIMVPITCWKLMYCWSTRKNAQSPRFMVACWIIPCSALAIWKEGWTPVRLVGKILCWVHAFREKTLKTNRWLVSKNICEQLCIFFSSLVSGGLWRTTDL